MRHWKLIPWLVAALLLFGFIGLNTSSARTNAQTQALQPGSSLTLTCTTRITFVRSTDRKTMTLTCAPASTATPTRTTVAPTATAQPTKTQPAPTNTPAAPTATPTATATQHHHHPTATPVTPGATATPATRPTNTPSGLDTVDPVILGTCPAEVHDRYVTAGPNGKLYRTWHPQEVPLDANNPSGPKCRFAHEHGDDPTTSRANPSLPPFGYINEVAGHPNEAHEGFKVFVANEGDVSDEGRTALANSRVVFHMGTGGVRRYIMPHHSVMIDLVLPTGQYARIQGLFDTRNAGSICERDRTSNDGDLANDVGRTVVTLPGTGCDLGSLYEIWSGEFSIKRADGSVAATMGSSVAVFDPITVMDPADRSRLLYTRDVFADRQGEAGIAGPYNGCKREAYHTGAYWYNSSGPTVYFTDGFGNPGGGLRQEISNHSQIGADMSYRASDGYYGIYRTSTNYCAPGLGLKN